MKNHTKFALILCSLTIICLAIMEFTGRNQSFEDHAMVQTIFLMIAPVIVIIWGMVSKKKERAGILSYKEAIRESLKISLVFGLISPFIFLAYYTFINPEIVASIGEVYKLTDKTNTQIIGIDMAAQFVFALVFGLLIGVIAGICVKSKSQQI
ncbi:MAG: DUF4199 family protein [Patescibacteria group bacterium]